MDNAIGNLSTVIKIISMSLAGWFIGILISKGLNLPISEAQLSEVISSIIFIIIGYIDAKYPNTLKFLGNNTTTTTSSEPVIEDVLNDEYTTEFGDDADGC